MGWKIYCHWYLIAGASDQGQPGAEEEGGHIRQGHQRQYLYMKGKMPPDFYLIFVFFAKLT